MAEIKPDVRTEKELILEALAAQNACNLSGVVHSFSRAMSRLWRIADESGGKGTDWINTHRVAKLYADKILSLAGEATLSDFDPSSL